MRHRCSPYVLLFAALALPTRASVAQIIGLPRADSTIRAFITRLAVGDTTGIRVPFRAQDLLQLGLTRDSLIHLIASGLAVGPVRRMDVLNRTAFYPNGSSRVDDEVAYHVVGSSGSRLLFVIASTDSGESWIRGIRWQEAPANIREMNPFTLGGKSLLQYAVLLLAVLLPLASVATAVAAVRFRVRYRWWWAIACLVGVGRFSIAWTNGPPVDWRFEPVSFQLLSAAVLKYPVYTAYVVTIALPIGALFFWLTFRRRQAASTEHAPSAV